MIVDQESMERPDRAEPTYEKATDEWRQVVGTFTAPAKPVLTIQRRYIVSVGSPKCAITDPPVDENYVALPTDQLWYWTTRSEWRDLPTVTAEEVARERAAAGQGCTISTT